MYQRFASSIAILLLLSVGLSCSFRRPRSLTWHIMLEMDVAASDRESAAKQTVTVIERRLDRFGVHDFEVLAQGTPPNGRILVSLPQVSDPERLKKLISARGQLELAAVISPPSPSPVQIYNSKEDAIASLGDKMPANRRVLPYFEQNQSTAGDQNSETGYQPNKWVVVEAPAIVDGSELRNAVAVPSRVNAEDYHIAFSLTPKGAERFGDWTGAHINDYISVVLNDEIKSIAYIRSRISDQGEISGRFSKQPAEDLALSLQSGALPAAVKIVDEGANK